MPIQVIAYNKSEAKEISLEEIPSYPAHVKWISLISPDTDEINKVSSAYCLHPLVIEDMTHEWELPKVDEYPKYTFIVMDVPDHIEEEVVIEKLFMVLGKDFLISKTHKQDIVKHSINMIFSKSKSLIDKNSDFLAYTLIDTAVDRFYPILDEIENSVSDIEDLVLEKPDRKVMNRMTDTRTKLLFLRKSAWLIREVLSSLERGSSAFIASKTIIYLRDVYDHIAQIMDLVETYRDILASSRDTYMSSVSNSLNEIMKQLTIISTIMLPLTFIVGVYGMNFKYFPELEWRYGYFAVWAVIIILVITMIAYFKIKKWI